MKDAKGHGSDARGGGAGKVRGMPIAGHPYHTKTNDELQYIAKDASEAARAQRGMASEGKYLDQVNDASTVLGWRSRGGKDLSQSRATDVAAQHGIGTGHLNAQGFRTQGSAYEFPASRGRGATMTPGTATSVGMDAGNKSMRAAGRTVWNEDDQAAATKALTAARKVL